MAYVTHCHTCGIQILDDLYCSQECAAAGPSDLLARIKDDLSRGRPINEETKKCVLAGNWITLDQFRKQLQDRRFHEGQRRLEEELNQMEEFQAAQEAVRKVQSSHADKKKNFT